MLEIFQYDFMVRAFIAGLTIAIIAPMIGIFLVVRHYSLMADTLAHVALLGVAIGFITKQQPLPIAIATSVVAAIGMEKLRNNKRLAGDSILALFLSGSLAIAVVLISIGHGFNGNLFGFLFGSIATVSTSDLYIIVGLGIFSSLVILGLYKELFLVSLDEEIARSQGLRTSLFNVLVVTLAALSVSMAIKIVGVLLIGALMVIPVMTAMQFNSGFRQTIGLAILFSILSVSSGLFLSYYTALASGGTIVLISLGSFVLSLLFTAKNS